MAELNRRDVASRKVGLFRRFAMRLSLWGVSPNIISIASIGFALLGSVGIYELLIAKNWFGIIVGGALALIGIQGRLICNLLDGLVAIEGGKKTSIGDLYNEVPDRVSDTLLIAAAGFGLSRIGYSYGAELGLATTLAALGTAYIRVLGGSLSLPQSFRGPMEKQHRMALLNVGVGLSLLEFALRQSLGFCMSIILVIILLGSCITVGLRLSDLARILKTKS